jgi:hypothetical protein
MIYSKRCGLGLIVALLLGATATSWGLTPEQLKVLNSKQPLNATLSKPILPQSYYQQWAGVYEGLTPAEQTQLTQLELTLQQESNALNHSLCH